jgi:hypothetical protein
VRGQSRELTSRTDSLRIIAWSERDLSHLRGFALPPIRGDVRLAKEATRVISWRLENSPWVVRRPGSSGAGRSPDGWLTVNLAEVLTLADRLTARK